MTMGMGWQAANGVGGLDESLPLRLSDFAAKHCRSRSAQDLSIILEKSYN
jgi:hypothetical protein